MPWMLSSSVWTSVWSRWVSRPPSSCGSPYGRFGKGVGDPGVLTHGDCLAYGVAMAARDPLLFKGEALEHTDVVAVEY